MIYDNLLYFVDGGPSRAYIFIFLFILCQVALQNIFYLTRRGEREVKAISIQISREIVADRL